MNAPQSASILVLTLCAAPALSPAAALQLGDTPEAGDRVGSALVTGDFNGDGIEDLLIGAPGESVTQITFPPPPGGSTYAQAGVVHLVYGAPGGLTTAPKKILKQSLGSGSQPGLAAGNAFGTSLAGGDFNADGFDDIAVGIPGQKINGFAGAGAVQVYFTKSSGPPVHAPVLLHQDYYGVLDAAEASDAFGSSLCSGDFDGDGFDDIAVGVTKERVGSVIKAGAVNVIHGSPDGMIKPKNSFWTQGSALQNLVEAYDQFGSALAAGDLNGDGFDELAVGVPQEGLDASTMAGVVHVLYGSAAGLLSTANQLWHQDSPGIVGDVEADDLYGSALLTGDFDSDGIADLAIGAPSDANGGVRAGTVNVLFGSTAGLSSTDNLALSQLDFTPFLEVPEEGDGFGSSLALHRQDAFTQLIMGVPGEDVNGVPDAGAVIGLGLFNRQVQSGLLMGFPFSPPQAFASLGTALATGDYNGEGHTDWAIGAPSKDYVATDAGEVVITLAAVAPFQEVLHQGN